jgi:hypothetical protein
MFFFHSPLCYSIHQVIIGYGFDFLDLRIGVSILFLFPNPSRKVFWNIITRRNFNQNLTNRDVSKGQKLWKSSTTNLLEMTFFFLFFPDNSSPNLKFFVPGSSTVNVALAVGAISKIDSLASIASWSSSSELAAFSVLFPFL